MGLGRRKVDIDRPEAWVFNRMADVYDARPPYPEALLQAIGGLAGCHVVDLGAGIGHLSLPLAARGLEVTAVEPAVAMLAQLQARALAEGLQVRALHAKAEAVPLPDHCADLVLIADALHFLDAELTGREVQRLLVPGGKLALLTAELADAPFMNALTRLMEAAAPRRPRAITSPTLQLAAVAGVTLEPAVTFFDATPLEPSQLIRIVRSISFIGPAMNEERFARFCESMLALPEPVWARKLTLQYGTRR